LDILHLDFLALPDVSQSSSSLELQAYFDSLIGSPLELDDADESFGVSFSQQNDRNKILINVQYILHHWT
jgi:hypothetical protein